MTNKNLFGFVEITDEKGYLFEETSSREGLIKNEAFDELVDFLIKSFDACRARVESSVGFTEKKNKREYRLKAAKDQKEKLQRLKNFIESTEEVQSVDTGKEEVKEGSFNREEAKATLDELVQTLDEQIDEIAMLRVLAGMGLSIGEFVHEIRQFSPAFEGDLSKLASFVVNDEMKQGVNRLSRNFEQFQSYAAYFDETIRNNANREIHPIEIRDAVRGFEEIIKRNALKNNIKNEENVALQVPKGLSLSGR